MDKIAVEMTKESKRKTRKSLYQSLHLHPQLYFNIFVPLCCSDNIRNNVDEVC